MQLFQKGSVDFELNTKLQKRDGSSNLLTDCEVSTVVRFLTANQEVPGSASGLVEG